MSKELKTKSEVALVSVILPVYNGEQYLKESVESILNQTYRKIELIIINDCSSDNSDEIIKSFEDERINYHKNLENLNLIQTLNKGISISKGKYIVRIDQDDIALPERIEKQVLYMETNPECVVCGSYIQLIKKDILTDEIVKYYSNNDDIKFALLFHSPFAHPAVIIRAGILHENTVSYNNLYTHAEDYQLWTKLSTYGKFHNIPDVLTHYRIHNEQTSSLHKDFQEKQINIIRYEYFKSILTAFSTKEAEIILNHSSYFNTNETFFILNKFMKNSILTGNAKLRYVNSRIKNSFIETNSSSLKILFYFLCSTYYWKNNFTLRQTVVLIIKSIMINYKKTIKIK